MNSDSFLDQAGFVLKNVLDQTKGTDSSATVGHLFVGPTYAGNLDAKIRLHFLIFSFFWYFCRIFPQLTDFKILFLRVNLYLDDVDHRVDAFLRNPNVVRENPLRNDFGLLFGLHATVWSVVMCDQRW